MARILIDTIGADAHNIPAGAELVAGYDTGPSWLRWPASAWARFKGRKVHIDQERGARGTSPVSDIENGAKLIEEAIGDARIRKGRHMTTTFYVAASNYAAARAAVAAAGLVDWVFYWIANWNLSEAEAAALLGGRIVAVQFASPSSNPTTRLPGSRLTLKQANCDLSVVADGWFSTPKPPPKHKPTPKPKPVPRPHPKVIGAGAGAALTTAIVAFLHAAGVVHLTPVELGALNVLGALVTGTVAPSKKAAGS